MRIKEKNIHQVHTCMYIYHKINLKLMNLKFVFVLEDVYQYINKKYPSSTQSQREPRGLSFLSILNVLNGISVLTRTCYPNYY